uniref:Cytochrome c oxidase assembly protein COX16 homolog, mitochondrial n=1 Tax=Leptobrachium leishanense TaxID=445787 RepID=A0A8C5PIM6_9ANUR
DQCAHLTRSKRKNCEPGEQLLIVGGSFGLREFTQIRYDAQHLKRTVIPECEKRIRFHLFSLWQKIKDEKFEDWKNIRGPRPWEDSKSFQYQHRDPEFSKNP